MMTQIARWLGAGGLLAVAAIHANWARGSAWPARDRRELAQAVYGGNVLPGAGPCLAVAALLTVAAGLVSGYPRRAPRLRSIGVSGVVAVLALRGAVGMTGRMPHDRASPAFARWNRRLYSPLCLTLAACSLASVGDAGEQAE